MCFKASIMSIHICVAGILAGLFLSACNNENDKNGSSSGGALDCPGVDGTYYYVLTPLGECADQGVTLLDEGTSVQNHGVVVVNYSGCTSTVTYNGCSMSSEIECSRGLSMTLAESFTVGDPNEVTGTQKQQFDGAMDCVYELYGSTDREAVLSHAGLSGDVNVSELSTPVIPNPDNISVAREECSANAAAEEAACPSGSDLTTTIANCTTHWQSFDARGCGDGWRAFVNCRTEHAADMNCETGEIPACDVYQNAYFQCTSAFASATGCSNAGFSESLCTDGGTYSYACLNDSAPFVDCTEATAQNAVQMYCCF
ncbi:MAG: hypothetical protein JXR76_06225 [Deltaproteobacteria bacterium]|nr:hypothetical protein [Deltaproteobacteria bacterium]